MIDQDPVDITVAVTQALQPIVEEMNGRLEGDLSERDETAVGNAITKAVQAGIDVARSLVDIAMWRNNITGEPVAWPEPLPDLWQERYGDEDDTEGE